MYSASHVIIAIKCWHDYPNSLEQMSVRLCSFMNDCPSENSADGLRKERDRGREREKRTEVMLQAWLFPTGKACVCFHWTIWQPPPSHCSLRVCPQAWRKLRTPVLMMNTCNSIQGMPRWKQGPVAWYSVGFALICARWIWDLAPGKGLCCSVIKSDMQALFVRHADKRYWGGRVMQYI